jgi:hypothetical protein
MMHKMPNETNFSTISYSYALGTVLGHVVATSGGQLGALGSNALATPYGEVISSYWNPTNAGANVNTTDNGRETESTQAAMKDFALCSGSGWAVSDATWVLVGVFAAGPDFCFCRGRNPPGLVEAFL